MGRKKIRRALIFSGGGARGAYHMGVWKYLIQRGWKPDMICGTSVGAINAVALGCGLELEDVIQVWRHIERGRVYRISLLKQLFYLFYHRTFSPVMDTAPLRDLIQERFPVKKLRSSPYEISIAATNILHSRLDYFDQNTIDVEHVMASSAIPILFPWQYVNGEPYWDGGVMANTPILPALERGATEIIVVLLSPVGGSRLPLPGSRIQAAERVFEMAMIGSYQAFLSYMKETREQKGTGGVIEKISGYIRRDNLRVATVAPSRMLGFPSLLDFSSRQADALIQEGYHDARRQLRSLFQDETLPY